MDDQILNLLKGEKVLHSNSLGTVTENCLVVRDDLRKSQAVIGISSIKDMRKVKTSNPALLAISAGLFTIGAASYESHEGIQVSGLISLIGLLFVPAYLASRRATVLFLMHDQSIESRRGTYREATLIIRAVRRLRESDG